MYAPRRSLGTRHSITSFSTNPQPLTMSPAPHSSVIYMEEMQSMREGTALWHPEPHSSGEVQIGDVGYIDQGAFIRLFNAISPDRYPVLSSEGSELPDNFVALKLPSRRIGDYRPKALEPGFYPSKSVRRTSIDATATACVHVIAYTRSFY